ncbi:NucA/NucB deoxyribonuclease domain-containing protein, partial [Micromonospora sp. NPDC051296]|uniref:NucA/NucB deoxyribonuclease domain-containing protein n=1 Tax=Micromonospora sp. NPDC051296 TaxID=3155046 RepID=UPI0034321047
VALLAGGVYYLATQPSARDRALLEERPLPARSLGAVDPVDFEMTMSGARRQAGQRQWDNAMNVWQSMQAARTQAEARTRTREVPVLIIDANIMPNIARNIQAAIEDEKMPHILNRNMDPAWITANRILACGRFQGTGSCDEYPFASSMQGGLGSRVAGVPRLENNIQGGVIGAFYAKHRLKHGEPYLVQVINLPPDWRTRPPTNQ